MRARFVAGCVGVLLVAVAALVFLQARQPQVAGTNTVAPYEPAWSIPGEATRCHALRRVPEGANRVQMALSSAPEEGVIQAAIQRHGVPVAQSSIRSRLGTVKFKLGRQTPPINRARLCISNLGKQRLVFLGEEKRTRSTTGTKRPVPSVIFLKPHTSSWLGRAQTILDRFGYVQAGSLGEWTLWVAGVLCLAMFTIAIWASVLQREPRRISGPPRRADGRWSWVRAQLARVPKAGWTCATVGLLNALTWSLIVPLFQVPDEHAHVAYAQHLAEVGAPPAGHSGSSALSQEERQLLRALRWRQITHRPENIPLSTPRAHRRLEIAADRAADRAGEGGLNNATQNPPLYYGLAATAYRLSPSTSLADRVQMMRVASALLAALTALFAFLFVRELVPGTPWAWTVGGLAVAVQPLFGFVGGGVNSDSLLFAASAGALLALAVAFRRGLTVPRGAAIGACTVAGLLAKATMFGLLPGIALGVILIVVRTAPARRREALRGAAAVAAAIALPVAVYVVLNTLVWDRALLFGSPQADGPRTSVVIESHPGTLIGHLTYAWQFYLPRLEVMDPWFPTYQARDIWFDGFIGRFGWLDYGFPGWVYDFGLVAGAVLLALAGRELASRLHVIRRRVIELITYMTIIVGLLALLAWIGYDWRRGHPSQFEQARYILPLLAFYGGFIAIAARGAGRRWGPVVGVIIVSIALAQSVLAMLVTLTRYYG